MPNKDEIFNYVMNTPDNTNPAVLKDMLNGLSDGGNPGYDVKTTTIDIIPEQTVALILEQGVKWASIDLVAGATAPTTLTIIFNGVEYEIPRVVGATENEWEYNQEGLFTIYLNDGPSGYDGVVMCPSTGPDSVTIKAYTIKEVITVTDDFKDAVDFCTGYSIGTSENVIIPEQMAAVKGSGNLRGAILSASDVEVLPETMTVILNGEEYEVIKDISEPTLVTFENNTSGGVSFTISFDGLPGDQEVTIVGANLPDSITIEAYATEKIVTVTDDFKTVVAATGIGGLKVTITSEDTGTGTIYTMDKFAKPIFTTLESGIMPLFVMSDNEQGFDIKNLTNYSYETNNGMYNFEIEGILRNFIAYRDDNYPTTGTGK